MKLGTRIFFSYMIVFIICFAYPFDRISGDLRTRYVEGIEDPLVDLANVLAGLVGMEMESGGFKPAKFHHAFERIYSRPLAARLHDLTKNRVDVRVYITDLSGKVIFDSTNGESVGADYSRWRDVWLTLRGRYGARTTRQDPHDPASVVLYVAAPLMVHGKIAGVLTVAKPTTIVNRFAAIARPRIIGIGAASMAVAIVLGMVVSFWIARPIKRLTQYAIDVRDGKKVDLPNLGRNELSDMAKAFGMMREALEGGKYVERYVQTLTHEIKSPLSAIRGAAELMEEKMSPEVRARFLHNIRTETNRIQDLVDRMLKLTELENRRMLDRVESIVIGPLIGTVIEAKEALIAQKKLQVTVNGDKNLVVKGDPFLLHQALSNIVQNAIDFSPSCGSIRIEAKTEPNALRLTIEDEGPGVPEYAKSKVFEKFYSLKRPDTGKKSTGLGLNFVKEVMNLHHGKILLENLEEKGLRAIIVLNCGSSDKPGGG
ncbi:MAG: two-component system sensor histidine kinase CreC [Syntrophobacteraceae bacterium]|nr:two-component system sensor histidine kinase CreC [Syntrophobacteraceae bacterium]